MVPYDHEICDGDFTNFQKLSFVAEGKSAKICIGTSN
jgi:hypothetical protein